jgi:hypothetical protein
MISTVMLPLPGGGDVVINLVYIIAIVGVPEEEASNVHLASAAARWSSAWHFRPRNTTPAS